MRQPSLGANFSSCHCHHRPPPPSREKTATRGPMPAGWGAGGRAHAMGRAREGARRAPWWRRREEGGGGSGHRSEKGCSLPPARTVGRRWPSAGAAAAPRQGGGGGGASFSNGKRRGREGNGPGGPEARLPLPFLATLPTTDPGTAPLLPSLAAGLLGGVLRLLFLLLLAGAPHASGRAALSFCDPFSRAAAVRGEITFSTAGSTPTTKAGEAAGAALLPTVVCEHDDGLGGRGRAAAGGTRVEPPV